MFILECRGDILTEQQVAAPHPHPPLPIVAPPQQWEAVGGGGGAACLAELVLRIRDVQRQHRAVVSAEVCGSSAIPGGNWWPPAAPDSCHDVVIVSRSANRKRPAAPGAERGGGAPG